MRLTFALVACLALAGAAVFVIQSEQQLNQRRSAARAFDVHAREASDALHDLGASEEAYVAAGQGITFWMPKVSAILESAGKTVAALRADAASENAKGALDQAAAALTDLGGIDQRARDYLKAGQQLMAADVIFTEATTAAAAAARQVEAARAAEDEALDAGDADARKIEAAALAGAAALAALVALGLVRVPRSTSEQPAASAGLGLAGAPAPAADDLALRQPPPPPAVTDAPPRTVSPMLQATATLCTDFGRVRDAADLNQLLARAADLLDATGVVVWLGSGPASAEDVLRPVLAHGYTPQVIARMPLVPRSANNAAAAAYRTGRLQIVLGRPGTAHGAIVAPLLAADGCIGALSVEVRGGGEASDAVQALAAIFAAQIAPIVGTSAGATTAKPRAAASNA
jgi:hypothetical protein